MALLNNLVNIFQTYSQNISLYFFLFDSIFYTIWIKDTRYMNLITLSSLTHDRQHQSTTTFQPLEVVASCHVIKKL